MLIDRGVHAGESLWHFNAEIFCKSNTNHTIARINLMTQTNCLDLAVTIHRVTNANHRIGEIDEPRLRTRFLHSVRNLHDRTNIARSVCETTWSAIFCVGVSYSILDWNLEILFP